MPARPSLLSVVIPCYRSQTYIEGTVNELITELEPYCPFEIVLVNDGSPDDVQPVIERLAKADKRIRYLELGTNRGQHFATLRGFAASRGDCVVTVDDDGQNPPSAVKATADALMAGQHDVVYGKFGVTSQSLFRVLASRINRWITRHTLGNFKDVALSNVRAIRGKLARIVGQSMSSEPYLDALLWRTTKRIIDVPVEHRPRREGQSTYSLGKLLALWASHLTLLSVFPLRVAAVGSLIVSVFSVSLSAAQIIRVLFVHGEPPPGWLSLFMLTSVFFSVLFAFLAVVSTYVGRIYGELNSRTVHWVRSSTDDLGSHTPEE